MANQSSPKHPDYVGLVRFLLEPLLDSADTLRVDCEVSSNQTRALVRLAVDGPEKGRAFGRGGRNIYAIRTVLSAAAQAAGQTVHLDVFGGIPHGSEGEREHSPRSASHGRPDRRDGDRPPRPTRRSPESQ